MKLLRFSSVLLALAPLGLAQARHLPSNDDLRHLRGIAQPELSPDGRHVVAVVQDSTADGGKSHLWLMDTAGAPPRQLTFNEAGERSPAYLPDGSTILFLSKRENTSGLFRLPLGGGEAVPVMLERSPAPGEKPSTVSVNSFSVAPDGKTVAVVATDPRPASYARDQKEKRDVLWVEHDDLKHRLYLLDTATWKETEVPNLTDIESVSWPDSGDQLLVLSGQKPRDLGPSTVGTLVSRSNPATQKRIPGLPVTTHRAVWRHGEGSLLLLAQCELDAPSGCADLYTFDVATGKQHNLTRDLKDSTISPETLEVLPGDRRAVMSLNHGMHATPALLDLQSGKLELLDLGSPVISSLHPNASHTGWAWLASSSTAPPALLWGAELKAPGKVVPVPALAPPDWMYVPSKLVTWKRDRFTVEGLLYLPPGLAPGTTAPLVVNVHGGPTGQFNDSWSPLTSLLLAQGWAVLITNPRGSTGYGVEFEAANKDDMGNGDFLDIMAGVDTVLKAAPIDADRMALIGYSYGGEMAGFVEGKTDRFKAIVSGAPVIDQFSEYGTESDSFGDRWFTGEPWLHFESAWRQSPLAYAGHAKTPFLLLQGVTDTTDPEGQSREMYRALRQGGVPVQLLLFPREDHGALGANFAGRPSTEPWAGVIARKHMIQFIRDGFEVKLQPVTP